MFKTYDLTRGEVLVLAFIRNHAGKEFTATEIEEATGVRAEVIPRIMENLRHKGHEVCSRAGKHYWPTGSWKGAAILGILFGSLFWVWIQSFIGLL